MTSVVKLLHYKSQLIISIIDLVTLVVCDKDWKKSFLKKLKNNFEKKQNGWRARKECLIPKYVI